MREALNIHRHFHSPGQKGLGWIPALESSFGSCAFLVNHSKNSGPAPNLGGKSRKVGVPGAEGKILQGRGREFLLCAGRNWIFQADVEWIEVLPLNTQRVKPPGFGEHGHKRTFFLQLKCGFPWEKNLRKSQIRPESAQYNPGNWEVKILVLQGWFCEAGTGPWCSLGALSSPAVLLKGWVYFICFFKHIYIFIYWSKFYWKCTSTSSSADFSPSSWDLSPHLWDRDIFLFFVFLSKNL